MKNEKPPTSKSYHEYLIESLKDPVEAAAYIEAALEEGDPDLLALAMKNVMEARSRTEASVPPPTFFNIEEKKPEVFQLVTLLDSLGFQLKVAVKEEGASQPLTTS